MKSIAVFCGSKTGNNPLYVEAAKELGRLLTSKGITLVFGGGKVGLMGVIADEVIKNGGKAIGVIPEKLMELEVGHKDLTELRIVKDMHERKSMINQLSDGFICMPGGIGTLEELFEVYTWFHIGYHNKPCALLNVNNFYTPLMDMLDHTVKEGFLSEDFHQTLYCNSSPSDLLKEMSASKKG